jgi:glycosyltransferase involved in cell wall biosynthesis
MFNMERALTAAGITIVTATTDHGQRERGPSCKQISCGSGKVTRFHARKLINFYKVAPGLIPWLWTNVRTFDIVHIHALFSFSSLAAGLIAGLRGVPYVVRPLGTLTGYGLSRRSISKKFSLALIDGPILRGAAAVHFTSNDEWDEARALKIAMRGTVIPLGVEDAPPGVANRLNGEYPFLEGQTAILFLSRLDPKKNVETLIDAFASSTEMAASSVLLIAGSGNPAYADILKARAQSLGIGGRVIWLGHLEGLRKRDALARADIFVLPSFSENFGIAAVEAMLARLPCVLGENVAVAKQAAAENAAFSVSPSPEAIGKAIERLLVSADLRREMGAKAREHAMRYYSPGAMAQSLKCLYASIQREGNAA